MIVTKSTILNEKKQRDIHVLWCMQFQMISDWIAFQKTQKWKKIIIRKLHFLAQEIVTKKSCRCTQFKALL